MFSLEIKHYFSNISTNLFVIFFFQKMRERNNEASKRCRLKRRMKAVSMENQSSMLNMANKMLKQRIKRLEHVGAALKEGVDKIRAGKKLSLVRPFEYLMRAIITRGLYTYLRLTRLKVNPKLLANSFFKTIYF